MRLTHEYVNYMTQQVVQRLIESEMIETSIAPEVTLKVHEALVHELAAEDRINDKVREYLTQYADEMQRSGASYQEMFKRIKAELVRREKVIL